MSKITPQAENFSQWYLDVCQYADLMDYAPVKGCIIFKPYGYAIWENIQTELNARIKALGVSNAYFPMLIPESFLLKEADHVEGFAPELLTATRVGQEPLEEPYVLRPTSETIMYASYAKWIQSYRDLPVKMNQWANVFRWEKKTKPFLRTSEFLWQEGHTVHATHEEAATMVDDALSMYYEFQRNVLAFSGIKGRKSVSEQFPGAEYTTTIEAMAADGKAIQSCTSHHLGENFSKAFDVSYMDADEQKKYGNITSWGMSTRIIGAMIMVHGDDKGLRLPPKLAPIQLVIVPIAQAETKNRVESYVYDLKEKLQSAGISVHVDISDNRPGFKFAEWEAKGVPVRIECGARDIDAGTVMVYRRDTQEKKAVSSENIEQYLQGLLEDIHTTMLAQADARLLEYITDVSDFDSFQSVLETKKGFIRVAWCGDSELEAEIKEKTKATHRCTPFDQQDIEGRTCFYTGRPATEIALFARAY